MLHLLNLSLAEMTPLLAQAAPAGAAKPPGIEQMLVPMVLFGVIVYFMILRPQKQREKQLREMVENLKTGDEVVVNGIYGVVANLKDGATLTLKIADNVRIEVDKKAVTPVAKTVELQKA
jgi:preprotein translocase subunit YajC